MKRLLAILPVACTIGVLAACGGEHGDKAPPGSASNPLPALPNPTRTRTPPKDRLTGEPSISAGPRSNAAPVPKRNTGTPRSQGRSRRTAASENAVPAVRTGRRGERKQKALPASASRPCSLVSKSQAQAIFGARIVQPLQAPQGPTCIYRTSSGKQFVTLAVQTVSFAKLKKQIRNARRVDVTSRTAYCGTHGRPMLYLPVAAGRVLSIAAPCSTAARFAAKAAAHL